MALRPQVPYKDRDITRDELACVYSALILTDDDIPVTGDKLNTVLKAAGIDVESIWPSLFARALQGINIKEMIIGSLSGGGSVGGAAVPAPGAASEEVAKEEQKAPAEDEEDSEDEDFGLSLFD